MIMLTDALAKWLCASLYTTQEADKKAAGVQIEQLQDRVKRLQDALNNLKVANSAICADVGIRTSSTIIAATTLGGGRVEIIRANIRDLKEFLHIVHRLRTDFGPVEITFDAPGDARAYLKDMLRQKF